MTFSFLPKDRDLTVSFLEATWERRAEGLTSVSHTSLDLPVFMAIFDLQFCLELLSADTCFYLSLLLSGRRLFSQLERKEKQLRGS